MYDPMEHESFVVQDEMKQPKKKNPMGFKIVALCLACTLLGGGAGRASSPAISRGGFFTAQASISRPICSRLGGGTLPRATLAAAGSSPSAASTSRYFG